jgi:hypothetical protein
VTQISVKECSEIRTDICEGMQSRSMLSQTIRMLYNTVAWHRLCGMAYMLATVRMLSQTIRTVSLHSFTDICASLHSFTDICLIQSQISV